MLQVAIGAVLLVAGMVAIFPLPLLGVAAIASGYLLIKEAPPGAGQELQGVFFGLAILGLAATLVVGLLGILF
ncbi:hypothetical protein ACXVSK_11390 [Pseudomonas aeruginosa]|uniref:hypothetical protein n=1 Tax=Pseudomonas aeruginosa TaxID=287 RepID=UPI00071BA8F1|nr:hypothetical protein [Pseudomonas aeruginosa]EKY4189407.1 hypothetical protein [Pseudomonas aeruginosa]ELL1261780.1 hypothetical protein [Pseudomonas aeruginosa]ELT3992210.1 hypothetical protein [Pseudomonas aeruginosa]KSP10181.1 hypothetical protein APB08_24470 [Pseudomonas aeruginosa]MBG4123103.1 hypothetical protein [Pseudomonas aeruginosa]